MKTAWRDTAKCLESANNAIEVLSKIRYGKLVTSLDRLRSRYRRFYTLSFALIPCSFSFMLPSIFPIQNGLWLTIAFCIYFLTCGLMDRWLYDGIGSIDCLRMSVSEVIHKSRFYRKRHLQFIMCLLPMAFLVIGLMAYCCKFDRYIVQGMIIGGITGLAIGSWQLLQFLRDYRKLINEE
ncbi:MAG: hypothetical protein K2K97_08280 [Muribaculaceae bacterium]|nr:hypothetical protein [Muribaculaceae bacterium]